MIKETFKLTETIFSLKNTCVFFQLKRVSVEKSLLSWNELLKCICEISGDFFAVH